MTSIKGSVNLTFLRQLTSAGDMIIFKPVKGFGSLVSFLLADSVCFKLLLVWASHVRLVRASVLVSLDVTV